MTVMMIIIAKLRSGDKCGDDTKSEDKDDGHDLLL
jgi:hypothetical protein